MPVLEKAGSSGTMTLAGTSIGITEWTFKSIDELADSTDSTNYDAVSGRTYRAQVHGNVGAEGSIKGNFDFNATSAAVIQKLKAGAAIAAVFSLDRTTTYASCNVDLSDIEVGVTVPGAKTIEYSANWKSNGVITWT